jgi:hypothetical protein
MTCENVRGEKGEQKGRPRWLTSNASLDLEQGSEVGRSPNARQHIVKTDSIRFQRGRRYAKRRRELRVARELWLKRREQYSLRNKRAMKRKFTISVTTRGFTKTDRFSGGDE